MTTHAIMRLSKEEQYIALQIPSQSPSEALVQLLMLQVDRAKAVYFHLDEKNKDRVAILFDSTVACKTTLGWMQKMFQYEPQKMEMIFKRTRIFDKKMVFN